MSVDMLAIATCLECKGGLESITVGRIIAGREGSAILRCVECGAEHHFHVTLTQIPKTPLRWQPDRSQCGTDAGYQRHQSGRTEVCTPCRVAHAQAARMRNVGERVGV